ncbi:hypothetical protein [Nakamurella endophytica]|uniref:YfhO family protein n=1 Tax=Nakamurella endophytica TaxID=1748367 RepID=A0A917SXR4_9ACTN|nr:hypothetical protein [Nakamurella endophytica]GGM01482.1 hypothetical protein GCM10011594_21900 [Nakamurella endophytica]
MPQGEPPRSTAAGPTPAHGSTQAAEAAGHPDPAHGSTQAAEAAGHPNPAHGSTQAAEAAGHPDPAHGSTQAAEAAGHPAGTAGADGARPVHAGASPLGAGALAGSRGLRRRLARTHPVELAGLLAVLVSFVVLLAIRIGPALVGAKVFGGLDLLISRAPWTTGLPVPKAINPFVGDTVDSAFPAYLQIHGRLWSGDLAWWSPLSGAGTALLSQPGIPTLTPTSIWMAVLPPSWAAGFVKLLQVAIAAAGMMLWLRRLGTGRAAGLIGGLVYAGSGFFVAWANWPGQASVSTMIPVLFWVVERFLQVRTVRAALAVPPVVAFLLLGGFPAAAGHALYGCVGYVVVRLVMLRRELGTAGVLRTLGLGVAAAVVGVLLSAVQVLPMARALADTDLAYRRAQFGVTQPLRSFMSLFFPQAMNGAGYPGSNAIEAYAFVGIGALGLAVLAVCAPRTVPGGRGVVWYLAGGFLLSAALVWKHGWWTNWLADVPVFEGNPSSRLRDMVGFFGSGLAGLGAQLLFDPALRDRRRRTLVRLAAVGTVLAAAFCVAAFLRYRAAVDHATFAVDAGLGVATLVLVVVALAAAGTRRTAVRAVSAVGVVALLAVQAGNSVAFFWPMTPPDEFYPENGVIAAAQADEGSGRVGQIGTFLGSTAAAYGLRTATGHGFQPTTWQEYLRTIDTNAYSGVGRSPTSPVLALSLTDRSLQNPLLDRLAMTAVVVAPNQEIPGPVVRAGGGSPIGPTASVVPSPGTVSLPRDGTVSVPLAAQPVRAVQVFVAAGAGGGRRGLTVTAAVTDGAGRVVASGAVGRGTLGRGWLQIPVAGESLAQAAGPLTLRLGMATGADGASALTLGGTGDTADVLVVGRQDDGLVERYSDIHGTVWSRTTALPRIRWAGRDVVGTTTQQRMQALVNAALPRDTVVLDAPGPQLSGATATLTTTADAGDRVEVSVDATGGGYVVLADGVQQDWRVLVDGRVAPLVHADHAFGAVYVPAGTHRVEFQFWDRDLRNGLLLSGASLLLLLAGVVLTGRHRPWRRRAAPAPERRRRAEPDTTFPTDGVAPGPA